MTTFMAVMRIVVRCSVQIQFSGRDRLPGGTRRHLGVAGWRSESCKPPFCDEDLHTVTKQCLATLHLPLLQFLFYNVASAICKSSGYLILGIKGSDRSIPMQYLRIRPLFPLSSHQVQITLQDNTRQLKQTNQKHYLLF